ncbi:NUDIX domain-containing protein [Actinacidiphila bryophytorum]|uniref:NUDIX domain-containing protein n=1 Tax=Actinacidiphila bryophytorum TaxID=1436133 RepID=UPI0021769D2F|nr:NUDIX domain-containing protein [Actinacidiphila bryophytorum]UWE12349.1 NUDIX domain-containing protein [Actinacidiphila bryophytorum]
MSVLHEDAVRVLDSWDAPDPSQDGLRQDYLAYLAAHPDGMWKPCASGHITAGVLVIDPPRERVLLTLHAKLKMWLQMGGHCEAQDSTVAEVALREGVEESGIEGLRLLVPQPVQLDRHMTPCAWHLDVQYAALAPEGAAPVISDESLDLRWFGYDEAEATADGSVRSLLARTRALL